MLRDQFLLIYLKFMTAHQYFKKNSNKNWKKNIHIEAH